MVLKIYHKILSLISTNKNLRRGALFSIFSFINKGSVFVLLIILGNYIMPEQYGLLSLFTTVVMFLTFFIDLSTSGYVSISFFRTKREEFRKDFSVVWVVVVTMTCFFAIILASFQQWLSALLKLEPLVLWISIVTATSSIFFHINLNYLRINEKIGLYGLISCSYAILNFFLSLFLVLVKDLNWMGCVYAQLITNCVYLLIALVWFSKDNLFCFPTDWQRYKKVLVWAIPLVPHAISAWMRQGVDRYIINSFHSTADVGLFSFALNLVSVITMVGAAFNATNSVTMYKVLSSPSDNDTKCAFIKRNERMITLVYILTTIIAVICVNLFVPFVLPKYVDSLPYFMILSIYGFLSCIYYLFCNYLFYYNKTKQLMFITFSSSVLHILLSVLFTRYSLFITCMIYVVSFGIVVFFVKRKARNVFPIK